MVGIKNRGRMEIGTTVSLLCSAIKVTDFGISKNLGDPLTVQGPGSAGSAAHGLFDSACIFQVRCQPRNHCSPRRNTNYIPAQLMVGLGP